MKKPAAKELRKQAKRVASGRIGELSAFEGKTKAFQLAYSKFLLDVGSSIVDRLPIHPGARSGAKKCLQYEHHLTQTYAGIRAEKKSKKKAAAAVINRALKTLGKRGLKIPEKAELLGDFNEYLALAKSGRLGENDLAKLFLKARRVNRAEFEGIIGKEASELYEAAVNSIKPVIEKRFSRIKR
jgi:Asp-tRNA(Asn)/Glu-tRNA(Gln) amidotransferase B subunit